MKPFLKNSIIATIFVLLTGAFASANTQANEQIIVDCPPVGTEAEGLGYSAQVVLVGNLQLVGTISKLKNGVPVVVHSGVVDAIAAFGNGGLPWGLVFSDQAGTFAIKILDILDQKPGNGELGFNGININLVTTCTLSDSQKF